MITFKLEVSGQVATADVGVDFEEIWLSKKKGFLMIKFKVVGRQYYDVYISDALLKEFKVRQIIKELRSRKRN